MLVGMSRTALLVVVAVSVLAGCDENPLEGIASIKSLPRMEMIDLASGEQTGLPTPTTDRSSGEAYALHGGKIYLFGGFTSDFGVTDAVDVYDIGSKSWSEGAPLPHPRAAAHAVVVGDHICVGAGRSAGLAVVEAFECYDTTSDSWDVDVPWDKGAVLFPVADDESVYAFGDEYGSNDTDAARFDLSDNAWHDIAAAPTDVATEAVVRLGDDIFVFDSNRLMIYSIVTNTWREVMVDSPPSDVSARAVAIGGEIYLVTKHEDATHAAYDPMAETWRVVAREPALLDSGFEAVAGNSLIVGGSPVSSTARTDDPIFRYTAADDTWETLGVLDITEAELANITGLIVDGDTLFVLGEEHDNAVTFGGG